MSKKQTKKEEKNGFTDKEAFEFMLENTILYWLDMLPLECRKLMIETKCIDFNWYYALNEQFKSDKCPPFETVSPTMIKYFLIDFVEEKNWKPKMGFNQSTFQKMFQKLKDLKERDEEYFMTKCFFK